MAESRDNGVEVPEKGAPCGGAQAHPRRGAAEGAPGAAAVTERLSDEQRWARGIAHAALANLFDHGYRALILYEKDGAEATAGEIHSSMLDNATIRRALANALPTLGLAPSELDLRWAHQEGDEPAPEQPSSPAVRQAAPEAEPSGHRPAVQAWLDDPEPPEPSAPRPQHRRNPTGAAAAAEPDDGRPEWLIEHVMCRVARPYVPVGSGGPPLPLGARVMPTRIHADGVCECEAFDSQPGAIDVLIPWAALEPESERNRRAGIEGNEGRRAFAREQLRLAAEARERIARDERKTAALENLVQTAEHVLGQLARLAEHARDLALVVGVLEEHDAPKLQEWAARAVNAYERIADASEARNERRAPPPALARDHAHPHEAASPADTRPACGASRARRAQNDDMNGSTVRIDRCTLSPHDSGDHFDAKTGRAWTFERAGDGIKAEAHGGRS